MLVGSNPTIGKQAAEPINRSATAKKEVTMKKHEKWSGVKVSKDDMEKFDRQGRMELIASFLGLCAAIGLVVIIIVLAKLIWGW